MNKYEAMFIVKPDMPEEERKVLFAHLHDVVTKNGGSVTQGAVWQERRKLFFSIKKYVEGVYYLMSFCAPSSAIKEMKQSYKINENILRVMITSLA